MTYCESCQDAALEDGAEASFFDVALGQMGGDIVDHDCEERETGERCNCACH